MDPSLAVTSLRYLWTIDCTLQQLLLRDFALRLFSELRWGACIAGIWAPGADDLSMTSDFPMVAQLLDELRAGLGAPGVEHWSIPA